MNIFLMRTPANRMHEIIKLYIVSFCGFLFFVWPSLLFAGEVITIDKKSRMFLGSNEILQSETLNLQLYIPSKNEKFHRWELYFQNKIINTGIAAGDHNLISLTKDNLPLGKNNFLLVSFTENNIPTAVCAETVSVIKKTPDSLTIIFLSSLTGSALAIVVFFLQLTIQKRKEKKSKSIELIAYIESFLNDFEKSIESNNIDFQLPLSFINTSDSKWYELLNKKKYSDLLSEIRAIHDSWTTGLITKDKSIESIQKIHNELNS